MSKTKPVVTLDVRDPKEELQVCKAFTLEHVGGLWCMATLFYKGDELIKVVRTEPNIRAIAANEVKMANARYWLTL